MLEQQLDPSMSSNVHYLLGQALARQDRLAEAAAEMRLVFSIDENGGYAEDAMYLLGDMLYRLNEFKDSSQTYMQMANKYPQSSRIEDVLTRAVNAQFNAKEFALAVSTTDRLLNQYPNNTKKQDLLYRKGLALYQLDMLDPALDTFAIVIETANTDEKKDEALYWTAYIHERKEDRGTASTIYRRLIDEYPNYKNISDVRLRKGYCDYKTGEFEKAFDQFHILLFDVNRQDLTPEIVFWLVSHCDQSEEHEEALHIVNRALEIFDDLSVIERALIAKGTQLVALKQWKAALDLTNDFATKYPDSGFKPENLWIKAKSFEGLGKKDEALAEYEQSLLSSQNHGSPDPALEASIYVDRGKILYEKEQYKDALESFLRVSILYDHPEFTPEATFLSIQCHLAMDHPADAQILYNDMLTHYPEHQWTVKAKESFANRIETTSAEKP
jgi:TolA-binding protein